MCISKIPHDKPVTSITTLSILNFVNYRYAIRFVLNGPQL